MENNDISSSSSENSLYPCYYINQEGNIVTDFSKYTPKRYLKALNTPYMLLRNRESLI